MGYGGGGRSYGGGGGSRGGGRGGRYISPEEEDALRHTTSLYVGGIPYRWREREVEDMFDRYGRIASLTVTYDRETGQNKGFAFVTFEDRRDAEDAFDDLQGENIDGRRIRLDWDAGLRNKARSGRFDGGGRGGGSRRDERRRSRSRSRSRGRGRDRRRSPSYSRSRSPRRDRSRGRKSVSRSRSRSKSRSRSRSPARKDVKESSKSPAPREKSKSRSRSRSHSRSRSRSRSPVRDSNDAEDKAADAELADE
ncbi:hypothetical protein, variant [Sphaeroforma arctica JP610]|uniref:RRM domain-containing protein n=1 Tax=Sphaeroforma arctica JP610 TaxID=667725 RepID=A0A0L0FJU1_9EUKA|nr:hypothetical protein, variant [Sphaeroforma arctica JP610]KNC77044.1 hypothetical protein, variant [Sphaeroforma arctica JP610]|eukprot:XP_014150946.1 hypothetical protein, variant [Sphaeroforma arctica JP610]